MIPDISTEDMTFNDGIANQCYELDGLYHYTGYYYYIDGVTWYQIQNKNNVCLTNTHPDYVR